MATRRVTTEKLPVLDFRKTQKDRLRLLALPPDGAAEDLGEVMLQFRWLQENA